VPDVRPWPARLAWLVLPIAAGPALGSGLAPRAVELRTAASVLLWAGWTIGVVAACVPRTVTLTLLRTLAPASAVAAGWAATAGARPTASDAVAVAATTLAAAAALSPFTGDAFVDGSSYGDERRFALRVPSAVLLGPLPLAWLAVVVGTVAGPLLLAAHRWVAGAVALSAGLPAAFAGFRSLHQLSRRWIVFVPNGMVLHDPIGQPEPTLFLRRSIRRLMPAAVGTSAVDLTQGAAGLALELDLAEPATLLIARGRSTAETIETDRLLFTPTRPGALLDEAARRGLSGTAPARA